MWSDKSVGHLITLLKYMGSHRIYMGGAKYLFVIEYDTVVIKKFKGIYFCNIGVTARSKQMILQTPMLKDCVHKYKIVTMKTSAINHIPARTF